jgi:VWFA-related protein
MIGRFRILASCALAAVLAAHSAAAQQQEPPRFRSSIDVTSVDVTVVDGRGEPVTGLAPGDFTVKIDGEPRRVVSAEWVPLATEAQAPDKIPPPPPEGYSSNANATGGRLIVMVIDQPHIRFGGTVGIRTAVNGFVDRLEPSDRVAVLGIGQGSASIPFTLDRARVKQAVERMPGQRQMSNNFFNIAISEALAIRRGEDFVLRQVQMRECGDPQMARTRSDIAQIEMCNTSVEAEAASMAMDGATEGGQTLTIIRNVLSALATIDAPKTMVLVSEGFVLDDQTPSFTDIEAMAAAARTSIYVLKLDNLAFDVSQRNPTPFSARLNDRMEQSQGVEQLAHVTRGSVFNVVAAADGAFARIESEISGYYLLGVESARADTDGKPHPVDVSVRRSGVTVRTRRQLLTTGASRRARTPRESVMAALTSPLVISALPLRVATFSLRGPESSKIQVLIHADIGTDYASSRPIALGYVITDRNGRTVETQAATARVNPVMNGVPSPLQFAGGASLDPGEYTLKLAVAEGERVGTIEHRIDAGLIDAEGVALSGLMVGGPVDAVARLQPTVGYTVAFGSVHGYVEAYGADAKAVSATYELARDESSPALLEAEVTPQFAGDERAIFSHVMPVRQLPPGKYVLRARLASTAAGAETALKTLTRTFEVARPAVLMTSAETSSATIVPPAEIYLPVVDAQLARPFDRVEPVRPQVVRTFRERVGPSSAAAFDAGVAALEAGDYPTAESSFKSALQVDGESTAALAYLAAVFAAVGEDDQAAGAWQTALIEGSDIPEIYAWLGDALMRSRQLSEARTILEEAVSKWPADVRFAKPLSALYATFGQGREAVRTLERHLEAHPEDVEALALGVEWIYHLHTSGGVARTRAEDVKLARRYADLYAKAKGAQLALVEQWMDAIENPPRR